MTIQSRNYPYNMASWLAEKSECACRHVCRLVDRLKELPLDEPARGDLFWELHIALGDLTKIIEYAHDTEYQAWYPGLAQRIVDEGSAAFKAFMLRVREFSDDEVFQAFQPEDRR